MNWLPNLFNFGSSALAGGLSYKGTKDTNRMMRDLSREQMDWQTQMSNTSFQRAKRDMELAGINPILAASQGGASTPSGSVATQQNALGTAVSSATEARRMLSEVRNLEEVNKNLKQQNSQIGADILLKAAQAGVANAQKVGIEADNEFKRLQSVPFKAANAVIDGITSSKAISSAKSSVSGFVKGLKLPSNYREVIKRGSNQANIKKPDMWRWRPY